VLKPAASVDDALRGTCAVAWEVDELRTSEGTQADTYCKWIVAVVERHYKRPGGSKVYAASDGGLLAVPAKILLQNLCLSGQNKRNHGQTCN
jgi:hypothetical protein